MGSNPARTQPEAPGLAVQRRRSLCLGAHDHLCLAAVDFCRQIAPIFSCEHLHDRPEESLWQQFWADHGVPVQELAYLKGLGEPATLDRVEEASSIPKLKVIGVVVDKVDRIMHGMELGSAGMHNQVRQWANEGFFAALLDFLLAKGFAVFVTADHGNVEALGGGSPKEGVTAEMRGERARIYSDSVPQRLPPGSQTRSFGSR